MIKRLKVKTRSGEND